MSAPDKPQEGRPPQEPANSHLPSDDPELVQLPGEVRPGLVAVVLGTEFPQRLVNAILKAYWRSSILDGGSTRELNLAEQLMRRLVAEELCGEARSFGEGWWKEGREHGVVLFRKSRPVGFWMLSHQDFREVPAPSREEWLRCCLGVDLHPPPPEQEQIVLTVYWGRTWHYVGHFRYEFLYEAEYWRLRTWWLAAVGKPGLPFY